MLRVDLRSGTRFARTSYVGPGRSDLLKIEIPGLKPFYCRAFFREAKASRFHPGEPAGRRRYSALDQRGALVTGYCVLEGVADDSGFGCTVMHAAVVTTAS
jgi:hypothetical protein